MDGINAETIGSVTSLKTLLVGVIGHVDHGKTALVRALTGVETDRLKEERDRGVSIVPGFALLTSAQGEIDLVDLPGHERFVRAMVSGATGMRAVLLAVDANEGIKPQTVEHLE
ncbi:MAG: translation elongation factor, partial [Alphaproteobacteria bacterium]